MVREMSVNIGEQALNFNAEASQEINSQRTCNAVARVDNRLNRTRKFDVGKDLFHISGNNVDLLIGAFFFSSAELVVNDHFIDVLDGRAVKRLIGKHHLQTVVVGRIMASGNRNAASCLEVDRAEIEHRSRNRTDVINTDTGFTNTFH